MSAFQKAAQIREVVSPPFPLRGTIKLARWSLVKANPWTMRGYGSKKLKSVCSPLSAGENSLVNVLGFDIGGANTKAAFINTQKGKLQDVKVAVEYFPVWKEPEKLASVLLTLKEQFRRQQA